METDSWRAVKALLGVLATLLVLFAAIIAAWGSILVMIWLTGEVL